MPRVPEKADLYRSAEPSSSTPAASSARLSWTRSALRLAALLLRRLPAGERLAVGERYRHRIGNLFALIVADFGSNHQLKKNASLQLLDRIDYTATRACCSLPLGVDAARRGNLDLEIGLPESAFPGNSSTGLQASLLRSNGDMRATSRLNKTFGPGSVDRVCGPVMSGVAVVANLTMYAVAGGSLVPNPVDGNRTNKT